MTPVRYTALAFQRLADPGTPHALAKRYGVRPGQPADAPLTSDGTLWFPDQHGAGSESHERRDGAVTMVGLRDDGSVSIADNAWLPEDHTAALRVELNIPSGWLLESVSYDLGAFKKQLKPFTLEVHGVRITGHTASVIPAGDAIQILTLNHGALQWPADEAVPVHPFAAFTNEDSTEATIALGGLHHAPELHAADRLPLYFYLLALSQRIYRRGSSVYAERRWHPTLSLRQHIGGCEHPHTNDDVTRANRAFAIFDNINGLYTKPGPKRGTVKAERYKSREEWHAALRGVALAKPIRTGIPTQIVETVANRLSIGGKSVSATTVRRYMNTRGPKTPEELRNGKWECDCHSCNA